MTPREGIPSDDPKLLRRALDGMPAAGLITIDRDDVIVQANGPSLDKAPSLVPGVPLRAALEDLTHVEMIDRLILHRQIASFAGRAGGPVYHWMIWGERNSHGELTLTYWDTDWNEVDNEQRAAFTMAAFHELKGPLTTIQGFAEILNMNPGSLDPQQAEAAAIIEQNTKLLSVLVQDVFDLSRNSFGELRLNLGDTHVDELAKSIMTGLEPSVEGRGQTLSGRIDKVPTITADAARVTQMITNLVSNASVHNPAGTNISVTVGTGRNHTVEITVSDDGRGLPFDDPRTAFQSFRRGDGATVGDRTGSGMGLTITQQLTELHRGSLSFETERGVGTSITLRFPLDREMSATEEKRDAER